MQKHERCYLAAVALNNSAIQLIERGRYPQALTVLQDSIVAMRDAAFRPFHRACVAPGGVTSSRFPWLGAGPGLGESALDLEEVLNRASRLVIDSASAKPAPGPSATPRVSVEPHVFDVDVPSFKTTGGEYPAATLPLLRIDAALCHGVTAAGNTNSEDDAASDDSGPVSAAWHLASMCVMNNLAVAALLHPLCEHGIRKGAVNTLRLGFRLAYRVVGAKDGGPFSTVAVLQLSVLMAQCCYQLHVEVGDCHGAWDSLTRYRALQGALAVELQTASLLEGLTATHAKAA